MATRQYKKSRIKGFIIPVFSAALLAYFIYHAQTGRYGIHAMRAMDIRAGELTYELVQIKQRRIDLYDKVAQLSDGSIEADALDENARKVLGLAEPDEVVILY